jgi:hypothetical protein
LPFLVLIAVIICGVIYARKNGSASLQRNVDFCFKCRKTNARLEQAIMTSHIWDGLRFEEALSATQRDISKIGFVPCIPPDAYGYAKYNHSRLLGHSYEKKTLDGAERSEIYYATSFVENVGQYDSEAVQNRFEIYIKRWKAIHAKEDDTNMPEPSWEKMYINFPQNERQLAWESMRCSQWGYAAPVGTYFMHGVYGMCEVVGYDEPPLGKSLCYRVKVLSSGSIVGGIHIKDSTIKKIRVKR